MRASAILIGLLALSLASCSVEPHLRENSKDTLGKLKGPTPDTIDSELTTQAEQAAAQGNFKQSGQVYKQLVDKSPDNMTYQMGYAEAMRRFGDCISSLKVTDAVLAKEPANPAALENKGLCLMSTGEFSEAGTVFSQVMKIDPKRWRTLNAVGILFAMKGKYDSAVAYFQAALNVSTDNPSVLNNAALTYAIDRQFDHSYDAFSRAKRHVQEGSAEAKHLDLNLALVYAVDGKLDLAEQTATPYLSKEALYNNMGFYSYLSKNNDLAKGYLNMALTQSPTYYERAWKNLGALTGDTNAGTGQPLPAEAMSGGASGPLPSMGNAASVAVPAASAGIALEDIPESKAQHNAAAAAAAAATPGQEDAAPAAPAPAKPKKTHPKLAQQPVTDSEDSAVPVPSVTNSSPAASSAPADNPDVVLLHKPAPAHNGDWDVDKKAELPPKSDVPGGAMPAASGSGN